MLGDIFGTGYTMVKDLLSVSARMKDLKLSKNALLRSYYFEIVTNLELLSVINKEALGKLSVNSPAVCSVFQNLEIQIGAFIVFSDDAAAKNLYEFLDSKGVVKETDEDAADTKSQGNRKKTTLQAVDFTLRKITVLQKLSAFKGETDKDILNAMRLKIRVENITEHLLFIRKKLEEFDKKENFIV